MERLKAYIVNEEIPHDEEKVVPHQIRILKEIYEKNKNIAVFTEYLDDKHIQKMYQGEYENIILQVFEPFCKFCISHNIPVLSLEWDRRYYFITNEIRSVDMFKKFLQGYYQHFYGKDEKNFVFFMGSPHGPYFEEMLKEMGYEVVVYTITLADKEELRPLFPFNINHGA